MAGECSLRGWGSGGRGPAGLLPALLSPWCAGWGPGHSPVSGMCPLGRFPWLCGNRERRVAVREVPRVGEAAGGVVGTPWGGRGGSAEGSEGEEGTPGAGGGAAELWPAGSGC